MTIVRDLTSSAAIRTLIGACDVTGDQSWVAYVNMQEKGSQWLITRQDETFFEAASWMSFGYEGFKLLFYPGGKTSGKSVPYNKWLLLGGTNDTEGAGGKAHFYAYDLAAKELLFVAEGAAGTPAHVGTPARLQFGRWDNEEQFKGLYAAAAIYNTTLTEANFLALAAAASVEDWLGLVTPSGLWVFDQESGEATVDLTGNGADGAFAIQAGFAVAEVTLPLPLRKEEGEEEEEGGGGVLVKSGGVLVEGKRYVKQGGVLVPA